ncbi:MAG TPA: TIGR03016 family PEP-CTERM system-associated outer membrane protein [Thiobacillaceae bacterium]|nr:TIGR03016 family PEP-CTERM system-associated outer membrane protein [Thiobacillaceae bacterium]HNU64914.1 TIGR03016 family PEP-CTERM system-associated outer membrane protein [Thiobacillaceae bacterium]
MASTAKSSRYAACLACLLAPAWAGAAAWKFTPGISLAELYTDNIDLSSSATRQSDWITEVRPNFTLRRQGARLRAEVDYSLQGLYYAQGTHGTRFRHYLNGRANAELVEDWFFLDASARSSQAPRSLSSGTGYGAGNPVGISNTSSVAAYTLSPYLKHRFGSLATVEARIEHSGVFIGDAGTSDAGITRYSLNATSGSAPYPLSWSAQYLKTDNDNRGGGVADTGGEQGSINARYQLTRTFGILGQAGLEKHDYPGVTANIRDYTYYGLGFFYTPGRRFSMDMLFNDSDNGTFISGRMSAHPTLRTSIDVSSSQRAYGRSNAVGVAHRTRRSNWSLRYQDDLTNYQQQFLSYTGSLFMYQCPSGIEYQPPGVPPSDPVNCTLVQVINLYSPTLSNTTYLAKSLTGAVSYTRRRNTWTLSVYENKRAFKSLAGGTDETRGMQASWTIKAAANTTYSLSGGLARNEESASSRSDDLWNLALVATRQFNPKTTGSVEVRHQERSSTQAGDDYKENSVAARLNMIF